MDLLRKTVMARCVTCERRLGRYDAAEQVEGGVALTEPTTEPRVEAETVRRLSDPTFRQLVAERLGESELQAAMRFKGPRAGTGIYLERFGERFYFRVRCKCGRNEKVRGFEPQERGGDLYV